MTISVTLHSSRDECSVTEWATPRLSKMHYLFRYKQSSGSHHSYLSPVSFTHVLGMGMSIFVENSIDLEQLASRKTFLSGSTLFSVKPIFPFLTINNSHTCIGCGMDINLVNQYKKNVSFFNKFI